MPSPGRPPHTLKQLKQKPRSRKAPLPPSPDSLAPPSLSPWSRGPTASVPQRQPLPQRQPHGASAAASLRDDSARPDPDTPPLTLLQELQTQSHEGRLGVRDPETRQRQKGRGRDKERREGVTGSGREAKGQQDPSAKEQAQTEGGRQRQKLSSETTDRCTEERQGEQGGGPGPEKWGARRTRRSSDSHSGQIWKGREDLKLGSWEGTGGTRKPLRDVGGSGRYWRPRRRGKPLGKYGEGGGNPQESGAQGSRRMCGELRGGLGECSVF